MFVYAIICDADISPVTGTGKYYVGKTKAKNLDAYFRQKVKAALGRKENGRSYLFNAIRKYGAEAFRVHPLMSSLKTNEQLLYWEKQMIGLMKAKDSRVGYNITGGGEGVPFKRTEEDRKKRSEALRGEKNPMWGRHLSEECRRKLSEANLGHPHYPMSPEAKERMRLGKIGQKASAEARLKMSIARSGKRNWLFGKQQSEETRAKMSLAWITRRQKYGRAGRTL